MYKKNNYTGSSHFENDIFQAQSIAKRLNTHQEHKTKLLKIELTKGGQTEQTRINLSVGGVRVMVPVIKRPEQEYFALESLSHYVVGPM